MTRDPIADPEVIADLRRRDASDRDRSRSRNDPTAWVAPAIVERWPCTGCSALVDMTRDAIELHAMFNRQLERRGERALAKRIPCPDCKRRDEELVKAQQESERARRRPQEQTELPVATPARPSWMPTPRAERGSR